MKHMILLLVFSFILVNEVGGYLNADPSIAAAATTRSDMTKLVQPSLAVRMGKPVNRADLQD